MKPHSTSIFWPRLTTMYAWVSFKGVGVAASLWTERYSGASRDKRARSLTDLVCEGGGGSGQ